MNRRVGFGSERCLAFLRYRQEISICLRFNIHEEDKFDCDERSYSVHNTAKVCVWDLVKATRQALEDTEAILIANSGRMHTLSGCYGLY